MELAAHQNRGDAPFTWVPFWEMDIRHRGISPPLSSGRWMRRLSDLTHTIFRAFRNQSSFIFRPIGYIFGLFYNKITRRFPYYSKTTHPLVAWSYCALEPFGRNSRLLSGKFRLTKVTSSRFASSVIMAFRALRMCIAELSCLAAGSID